MFLAIVYFSIIQEFNQRCHLKVLYYHRRDECNGIEVVTDRTSKSQENSCWTISHSSSEWPAMRPKGSLAASNLSRCTYKTKWLIKGKTDTSPPVVMYKVPTAVNPSQVEYLCWLIWMCKFHCKLGVFSLWDVWLFITTVWYYIGNSCGRLQSNLFCWCLDIPYSFIRPWIALRVRLFQHKNSDVYKTIQKLVVHKHINCALPVQTEYHHQAHIYLPTICYAMLSFSKSSYLNLVASQPYFRSQLILLWFVCPCYIT